MASYILYHLILFCYVVVRTNAHQMSNMSEIALTEPQTRIDKEIYHFYEKKQQSSPLDWTKIQFKEASKQPRARSDIFEKSNTEEARQCRSCQSKIQMAKADENKSKPYLKPMDYGEELKNYKLLCRGEMVIPAKITKLLHCRYLHEHHPFLRLAPIKMELVYSQPDVVVFHEVLSDEEIKLIKDIAKPRLKHALVRDGETGQGILLPDDRISNLSWIRDTESPIVARVSQRISDMTGLSMLSAESLQVLRYGVGEYYKPHYDFSKNDEKTFSELNGNRIATVLFYMSEVDEGGATVFTELGLCVSPIKGAAVFWMNLHPSGEGDFASRHAGCPVLRGSKWVCNKWLHQRGQELLRPCDLHFQREGLLRKLPRPVRKPSDPVPLIISPPFIIILAGFLLLGIYN